ncbi:MAG: hypothetical protein AMJ91_07010 [candidate division Zixibacteria bacterium SM23_73_3]|nr:MAG: hypothetical protein AMJ91_07010 [candidate division Zixibacteria bacterium SM23_73_3]
MLKNKKSIMMMLVVGLSVGLALLWGKASYADANGGIVQVYDDSYGVKHRFISHPQLDIEVWVDKGEGATYWPGEDIKVYFQASRDCYVVLYNIDTRGYVHLLYPVDRGDDPYIEGGRVYRIPDRFDDYDLTVNGPNGVEYIQAVASLKPLDLPNFPGEYIYEGEVYVYQLDGEDPFEFMAEVNAEIAQSDYASDICMFTVEYQHPKWYYWPRVVYVDRPVDIIWGGAYFDYPWGVEVWIDGVFYGITPITIPALVVGRHYVSFWFHGCWIWRDWFHVRRDYTTRVWADCYDRYRYVEERYVEKSYRAEKAKRRRGVGKTARLVKPVMDVEKGRLAKAEVSRIKKDKEFRREASTKRRGLLDRHDPSRLDVKSKPSKNDKVGRAKSIRRTVPSERGTSFGERKAKRITAEGKTAKKIKKDGKFTRPKQPTKTTQKIRKNESSQPKISKAKISNREKGVIKSAGVGKTHTKETRSSKSEKRRR